MAITNTLYAHLDGLRRYAGSMAWGPLVNLSRAAILSVLSKIEHGQLKIVDTTGEMTICGKLGKSVAGPKTELSIHKETFWVRMLLFADMVGLQSPSGCHGAYSTLTIVARASPRATCSESAHVLI